MTSAADGATVAGVVTIRPYRPDDPADLAGIDEVCVRTGDAGGDATGRWSSDDLLPDVFARPYLLLEPGLAFVLDDGGRVVGYVIGTADTPAFVAAWRERWLPVLARRWPEPPDPPSTAEERVLTTGWRPERMLLPVLAPYPAHLHVDVAPTHQGGGHGRALIATFLAAAAAAGARAVHLGMDPANTGARAFYDRLGFREITAPADGTTYLGRATSGAPA